MTTDAFTFSWTRADKEPETHTIEAESNSVSKTILKMKEVFMDCINAYMEEADLNKEEVALFEEVVSEPEDTSTGSKRPRRNVTWSKSQKRKTTYGKKSR